jgi:hypothetical protein
LPINAVVRDGATGPVAYDRAVRSPLDPARRRQGSVGPGKLTRTHGLAPHLPGLRRYEEPVEDPMFPHLRELAGLNGVPLPGVQAGAIVAGADTTQALRRAMPRLTRSLCAAYDARRFPLAPAAEGEVSEVVRLYTVAAALVDRCFAHLAEVDGAQVALAIADPRDLDRALAAALRAWTLDGPAAGQVGGDATLATRIDDEVSALVALLGAHDAWERSGGGDRAVWLAVAEILDVAARGWPLHRHDEGRHRVAARLALLDARPEALALNEAVGRAWQAVIDCRTAVRSRRDEMQALGVALDANAPIGTASERHAVALLITAMIRDVVAIGQVVVRRLRVAVPTAEGVDVKDPVRAHVVTETVRFAAGMDAFGHIFGLTLATAMALVGEP